MTEAQLLDLLINARTQLDATFAQLITLNFAMVVAIYYFLHRSGVKLKIAVFLLYLLGWFVFWSSAGITGAQLQGLVTQLNDLEQSGDAGATTTLVLSQFSGLYNLFYLIAINAANFLLLIGAFIFLFFWKPPADKAVD
ncbi:MAG: hypothetical protein ACX939_02445 [Hyphococcus sp.]